MAVGDRDKGQHAVSDVVGTLGLLLNIGGVISAAVWLSMVGGAYPGGSPAVAGAATVASLGASFLCFSRR